MKCICDPYLQEDCNLSEKTKLKFLKFALSKYCLRFESIHIISILKINFSPANQLIFTYNVKTTMENYNSLNFSVISDHL